MMQFSIRTLLSGLLLLPTALAAPSRLDARQTENCNTATNRRCWADGFDITTDYETSTPVTGVTRSYSLTLTEEDNWTGPDGVVKEKVMLVNGDIIGPTIYAQWGDTISVEVTNNLVTNGSTIHWHGIRQLNSNLQDGVNGVTECPIPPNGGSRTYTFLAEQYGTSWYHSHFSAQYGNGIVGPIQIDGPASLNYDVDLGPLLLTDYYHQTADEIVILTESAGPPASDNVLINGTNVNPTTGDGEYAVISLTPGKRHRLRLINTSVDNHFQVSLVNHTMTVIETDFVPVNSFTTDSLFVGVGQRYDVTIDASQAVDNYWFNITFGGNRFCGNSKVAYPAAILRYDGAPKENPTNPGTTPTDHQCLDFLNYTPVVTRQVPTSGFVASSNNSLEVVLTSHANKWTVTGSTLDVDWNNPIAQYINEGQTDWLSSNNIWAIDTKDEWAYWLIQNDPTAANGLPHPIHLHGHDFVVVGRSPDNAVSAQVAYDFTAADVSSLVGSNPLRRDVTMLPQKGWIVIAFKTDNPGAWLMHCHIAWHASGGLGVTFLERASDFKAAMSQSDIDALNSQCEAWNSYVPSDPFQKQDSGI